MKWGFFQAAVGNLVFLSNCNGELGILLELRWGTLNSSHVTAGESVHSRMEAGKSGFFSSCGGKIDVPFELQWRSRYSSRVATGSSGLLLS